MLDALPDLVVMFRQVTPVTGDYAMLGHDRLLPALGKDELRGFGLLCTALMWFELDAMAYEVFRVGLLRLAYDLDPVAVHLAAMRLIRLYRRAWRLLKRQLRAYRLKRRSRLARTVGASLLHSTH